MEACWEGFEDIVGDTIWARGLSFGHAFKASIICGMCQEGCKLKIGICFFFRVIYDVPWISAQN